MNHPRERVVPQSWFARPPVMYPGLNLNVVPVSLISTYKRRGTATERTKGS